MFKVLAAIHITVITMLAVNDVGTISCSSGKVVTAALPITVCGMLMITLALGIGIGKEIAEHMADEKEKV